MSDIKEPSKLILGTAQLGMKYGVANQGGQPGLEDALNILKYAWNNGINVFDTAPAYGTSEELLGVFICKNGIDDKVIIIDKLYSCTDKIRIDKFTNDSIGSSLNRLGLKKIKYYFLHDSQDIYKYEVLNALYMLKETGLIDEFGVSVYSVKEAEDAISRGYRLLQAPVNLFDHRFITEEMLYLYKNNDVTLFARSIFLQGLFFLCPDKLPLYLKDAGMDLKKLHTITKDMLISISQLAIQFVNSIDEVDHIIIGSESTKQLEMNIQSFNKEKLAKTVVEYLITEFNNIPLHIIDPRNWVR